MIFILACLLFSISAFADFPVSDHCDGENFYNYKRAQEPSFAEKLKYQTYMTSAWDDVEQEVKPSRFPAPPKGKVSYVKIGQSTVLIQTPELNILTDPIWSGRAGPNTCSGPLRSREAAVRFEDLPSIDVVLISHNHFDHLDLPTLHSLHAKFDSLFIVGLGTKKILAENGINNVVELDWWQNFKFENAEFNYVPALHNSGRGFHDRGKSLWGGFYLRSGSNSIYFSGDTGYGAQFKEIAKRLGSPSISFLPIGGYLPHWFQKNENMSPQEAVLAHLDLGSKNSEAIHYETFKTSHEEFGEPVQLLRVASTEHNTHNFRASKFGDTIELTIK